MKLPAASWARIQRPKRLTTVVMMLIIWAGTAGSLFAAITTDMTERDNLRSQATTIAATISLEDLKRLEGNESDLSRPEYRSLKESMQRIISENQDIRFIRIAGVDQDQPFFYLDSENPYTRDYTAPGYPYSEASDRFRAAFAGSGPAIEGPTSDKWGMWMAAYAPIVDPRASDTYAMVAIYTPAFNYYLQLLVYTMIPLLLTAIPLAGLLRDRKLETKEREIAALKNQFVSIASHELRSPITGMLWAIQSLLRKDDDLTAHQKSLLMDMYNSTASSLATVNEILDLSVFERGQSDKMQKETVDMVAVLQEVRKTLKLGANEKNIKIVFSGEWPTHAFVAGDVAALKRAFMNLIANAIKYSPASGEVELHYKYRAQQHFFDIKDHGIGIPAKEQQKVLEGYYRASNAVKIQAHGTGLGLWITRLVIEQHGGTVSLESKLHKGTKLTVVLPAYHQIIPMSKG